MPAILTGPYGQAFPSYEAQHVLAIAGGTGVTFTLPIIMEAIRQQTSLTKCALDLVWVIRKAQDLRWLEHEFAELMDMANSNLGLRVKVFVTRDASPLPQCISEKSGSGSPVGISETGAQSLYDMFDTTNGRCSLTFLNGHHPSIAEMVDEFVDRASSVGGNLEIIGSGPETMGVDVRRAVARISYEDGVNYYWDSRE